MTRTGCLRSSSASATTRPVCPVTPATTYMAPSFVADFAVVQRRRIREILEAVTEWLQRRRRSRLLDDHASVRRRQFTGIEPQEITTRLQARTRDRRLVLRRGGAARERYVPARGA